MDWQQRYVAPDSRHWQGRHDIADDACFFQLMKTLHLFEPRKEALQLPGFAFAGFSCDEGIKRNHGRMGAADGPTALRHALGKLPIHTKFGCYDVGGISCRDGQMEIAQMAVAELVSNILQYNLTPIVIGGGHELAWGHYQGIKMTHPQKKLGIVNFDAHFDLRVLTADNQANSGTPFYQIALDHKRQNQPFDYNVIGIQTTANIAKLFTTAHQFKTNILLAEDLQHKNTVLSFDFIQRIIDQNDGIYVSVCLDVFSSAFAPGVSACQPIGITPWQMLPMLRQLASSGKVIAYDFVELSPRYDVDQRTARLASSLISDLIHHTL